MFSIVVFAKDEEHNIPWVINQILQEYPAESIFFVLDGHINPSADILSASGIRMIEGDNRGKGAAVRKAIQEISSDVLIFMDADGSHDPREIKQLLPPLLDGQAEMVIGSRFLGHSEEFYDSLPNFVRYLGNIVGNMAINLLWNRIGQRITDAQNGLRGLKRELFLDLDLKENSFSIEQEMVIKCLKRGYRVHEVCSWERKRRFGVSHISCVHLFFYLRCLIVNIF